MLIRLNVQSKFSESTWLKIDRFYSSCLWKLVEHRLANIALIKLFRVMQIQNVLCTFVRKSCKLLPPESNDTRK